MPVAGLRASSVTARSVRLEWCVPDGPVDHYRVEMNDGSGYRPVSNVSVNTSVVGGLTPGSQYLFQVLLSPDVPLDDDTLLLWGWFTRFDPLADLHPARRSLSGNRVRLKLPILIDARWKKGYPHPVTFDPQVEKRVAVRWKEYGL